MDQKEIDHVASRLEAAFRVFDERTLFQTIFMRRELPALEPKKYGHAVLDAATTSRAAHLSQGGLYEESLYYVLLYLDPRAERNLWQALRNKQLRSYFQRRKFQELIESEIQESREQLEQKTHEFTLQLRDIMKLRVLGRHEAFPVLWKLLNFSPDAPPTVEHESGQHLDGRLADSFIAQGHDYSYLKVDDYHVILMGMKEIQGRGEPLMFRDLQKVRGNFHIVTTWKRLAPGLDLRFIQRKKDHSYAQRKRGLKTSNKAATSDSLKDGAKLQAVDDLEQLERRIHKREYSGLYSLTAVVYDLDPKRARSTAAEIKSIFTRTGKVFIVDRYNQPNALFGTVPGGYRRLHRRHVIMNKEHADMALWALSAKGEDWNSHLEAEGLAIARTENLTPFYVNIHGSKESGFGDVAHTIITGKNGSGKTVFLCWLILMLQKYKPFIVIFDQKGSYENLVNALGGAYVKVVPGMSGCTINPFAHEFTPGHHEFLTGFVRFLVESDSKPMSGAEEKEVYEEIGSLYRINNRSLLTLGYLADGLGKGLSTRLSKWVRGGQYGEWFDNVEDTLSFSDLQCFDFPKGIDLRLMNAFLRNAFHRVHEVVCDPAQSSRLKMAIIDEGEVLAKYPDLCGYIVDAAKTWRSYNGAVVWASQSIDQLMLNDDIEKRVLRPLIQSCATQIFLSNPSIDGDYKRLFGLTEAQCEAVRNLRGKDEILFKQGDLVKRLSTCLGPVDLALCGTDAKQKKAREEAVAEIMGRNA